MPPNRPFTNAILIIPAIFGITGCATPTPPPPVARVDHPAQTSPSPATAPISKMTAATSLFPLPPELLTPPQ
jgi:hypothetical protein